MILCEIVLISACISNANGFNVVTSPILGVITKYIIKYNANADILVFK